MKINVYGCIKRKRRENEMRKDNVGYDRAALKSSLNIFRSEVACTGWSGIDNGKHLQTVRWRRLSTTARTKSPVVL